MRYFIFIFLCLFSPVSFIAAQANFSLGEQQLNIELTPLFPEPKSEFTAKADDYALPVTGRAMRWYVDGQLKAEANNEREITLESKAVGTPTTIRLVVDLMDGTSVGVTKVVTPHYLDIIIEPQTRTPAFYKGRALPSIGSTINATAILDGGKISSSDLIYTWQINGQVIENGANRAKNSVSFPMPQGRFATIGLDVRSVTGEVIARKIFDVQNNTPEVIFYEMSTLFGQSEKAANEGLSLTGSTLSLKAEPYNLDLRTYNDPDLAEWKIAGNKSPNPSKNPYEITLAGEGAQGETNVSFHVRSSIQVLQGAQGSMIVNY